MQMVLQEGSNVKESLMTLSLRNRPISNENVKELAGSARMNVQ